MVRTGLQGCVLDAAQAAVARLRELSISDRLLLLAATALTANALYIGHWVAHRTLEQVARVEMTDAAHVVDAMIEPLLQDLSADAGISAQSKAALDQLSRSASFNRRFSKLKIWSTQGKLIYNSGGEVSPDPSPEAEAFDAALHGRAMADLSHMTGPHLAGRRDAQQLLEVYAPVHQANTDRIIAIAEVYEPAGELSQSLAYIQLQGWIFAGAIPFGTFGLLLRLYRMAGRTIAEQQHSLRAREQAQATLTLENKALRGSLELANVRLAESTERFMRRVGADLHDGPAQQIGLIQLHLDQLRNGSGANGAHGAGAAAEKIEELAGSALAQIRSLAAGLSPPDLDRLTLSQTLLLAIENHEWSTSTRVELQLGEMPDHATPMAKICLYRFVQEGLSNAFRHAGGKSQSVRCEFTGDELVLEVSDAGPGIDGPAERERRPRLGLSIMRDRIEALGGTFALHSNLGAGTRLLARLPVTGNNGALA